MATAAAVAVVIVVAWLAIALIIETMHMAATLTFIKRDIIRIMGLV